MARFFRSDPLAMQVLAALAGGASSAADVAARVRRPEREVARILEQAVAEHAVTRLDLAGAPSYSLTATGLEAVGVYQGVQGAVDGAGHVDLGAATRMLMEQYAAARDVAADDALREQAGWPADDAARDRVSAALNDAYARGALTKEQLDDRTSRALAAATMGELRAAGEGVIELPPALPTALGPVSVTGEQARLQVNPALKDVRWRRTGYAAALVLVGLVLLLVQPVVGLVVLAAAVVLGAWTLRPLLRTTTVRVRTR
ncbi:MAG TPA: DUF1707 domain-containing protein [Nocardioides sp.]|uniref:DUF1707 SHOCT-like domain-containing protein n=1 Tax=Nocardioides sp. TaxID=35761 RepID=UPI002F3E5582